MAPVRRRLDVELVRRGLVESREAAQDLIRGGRILVDNVAADKPARQVLSGAALKVVGDEPRYASRGAHKLISALDHLAGAGLAPVTGRRCLDAGASTGGFTDILLRRGAQHVIAVDVGYGQLVWALQSDDRVTVMDRTNIRALTQQDLAYQPELLVADLSFISLTKVLPALISCADPEADMLLMVKPQFEVGRSRIASGGVVRDPGYRAEAVRLVSEAASALGWGTSGVVASGLPGPSGNVEYFLWLRRGGVVADEQLVAAAVESGPQ